MIIKSKIMRRIMRNEQGAVLMEFAFIAPAFFLILMGVFDFGYSIYARGVLNGAVQDAARESALQRGAGSTVIDINGTPTTVANIDLIDQQLTDRIRDVVPFGTVTTERKSYFDFFSVERAEVFTDNNGDNICNNGEPYTDENNNNLWDIDVGTSGVGGPRDVVLYEIELSYTRIFPLYSFIGSDPVQTISAETVLRNQPYGQQDVNISTTQGVCS